MQHAIDVMLLILAVGILIPMAVFGAECLASVLLCRRKRSPLDDACPRTVVLMPAHDEEAVLGATLTQLVCTLRPSDRLLVVADNCTDRTAAVARCCGAEVLERTDALNRGKPFAVQHGLNHLAAHPPDVVVFLDADCRVNDETVKLLSDAAARANAPVQGLNLCQSEAGGARIGTISELGFRFKNLVRPLGPSRLGLPCHLMGTGMAIPWDILERTSFVRNHLAEDMQLGIEIALQGRPARFCPDAEVNSPLPSGPTAFISQRTRWEQGHLRTMLSQMPRLLWHGLRRRRVSLLFLALDLTVPPLALLATIWLTAAFATSAAGLLGASWLPAILLAVGGGLLAATVLAGWAAFCRREIPLRSLRALPWYVLRKLPIYARFFLGRRQKEWVRTERPSAESASFNRDSEVSGRSVADPPSRLTGRRLPLFGIHIDALRMPEAVDRVMGWIHSDEPPVHRYVVTPNADHTVMLHSQPEFRTAYEHASLVLADGMPVVLASRILRRPLPERVTGADLVPALFTATTERRPLTVYLLGAGPGVAERAAANIHARWPHVAVVGTYSPPFGFEKDKAETAAILRRIDAARPDVLVVGLGAPKQELWVAKHRERIAAKVSLCVGATIDFLAGEIRRAPRWMQRAGLEWLYRLLCEPRRLFKRYAKDACVFPRLVWREWRRKPQRV